MAAVREMMILTFTANAGIGAAGMAQTDALGLV